MLRFATLFRIMKVSKTFDENNEYFKVIIKNDDSEEKSFFVKSNINIEFNQAMKVVDHIDDEFIFNLANVKNKAISLKNVLTGKTIYIHPEHPSDKDSILNSSIIEHIEEFLYEKQ